jgi:hypothetical protein
MAKEVGFNVNKFVKGDEDAKDHALETEVVSTVDTTAVATTKRRKSKENTEVLAPIAAQTSMSYLQENIPYASAYNDTNRQLDEAIMQLDALGGEIVSELQVVRGSKTLRNKYNYINDMTATAASIINAKLSAIKEKNKTINDVNRMELERMKQLKTTTSEEDDNTRIANMYDAFINTPVGIGRAGLGPNMQDILTGGMGNIPNVTKMSIGSDQAAWEQGLSPAENRMVLEAKGAIETIVVYDEVTGNRWFDVVDKNTRQPVPNVEKPDSTYIYDLDINVRGGFAKDGNRNTTYPLVIVHGGDTSINEY